MSTGTEPYRPAQAAAGALQPIEVAKYAESPAQLVALAIVNQTPPETLSKLLDLQERWEKTAARKAFVQAMSLFKASAPAAVIKASKVDYTSQKGRTHYNYANLGDITGQLTPLLVKHNLHASWETITPDKGLITVTCHITHSDGHRESVTLCGPADASGSKNPLQAIGSAVTYLERYTLLAALGIATAEQDDDGRAAGQPIDSGYRNDATLRPAPEPDAAAKTAELAKPKPKTWEETLGHFLTRIADARKAENANDGQALLARIKAVLPNYKFPAAMQQQVDRAVADAEHAFDVGDAFDAGNVPPDEDLYYPSLVNLLTTCGTIQRLDEIAKRWDEDKENMAAEVYQSGVKRLAEVRSQLPA